MKSETTVGSVLLVDDDKNVLHALTRALRKLPIQVFTATNGLEACSIMGSQFIHVLLTDMKMPQMTGSQLVQWAEKNSSDTFKIILTGYSELEATIDAINLGKIQKHLQKPWHNQSLIGAVTEGLETVISKLRNEQLTAQTAQHSILLSKRKVELEQRVKLRTHQVCKVVNKLRTERQGIDGLLYNFISINPLLSVDFASKVSHLAVCLGNSFSLDEQRIETLKQAAFLSEIGLVGIASDIIKLPFEQLSIDQREAFFEQVYMASSLLLPAKHLTSIANILTQQYEQWDGNGFPGVNKGEEIEINARIIAVARDYWRCIEGRLLPKKCSNSDAINFLQKESNKRYDPAIVTLLSENLALFVTDHYGYQLSTGELKPGMRLLQSVQSKNAIATLATNHHFTEESIAKVKAMEARQNQSFVLQVEKQTA